MRRFILAAFLMLGMATAASAQTQATPASRVAFDTPDVTSVAMANGSVYKLYIDAQPPVTLAHTCVAATTPALVATCTAPTPAMTPGDHTLTVTRSATVNGAVFESQKSSPLLITMLIVAAPANLRVQE